MKVRLKVSLSGARNGVAWPSAGEEIDLPDQEGADLCAAGMAEPVTKRPAAETRPSLTSAETRAAVVPTSAKKRTATKKKG